MILHVANLGNPVLRKVSEPVPVATLQQSSFQAFLDDLLQSMRFHDGVGLAAPQVFSSIRAIAVWVPPDMDEEGPGLEAAIYINPQIQPVGDELEMGWEGCLSLKDLRGIVPRHRRIRLTALDRKGKPIDMTVGGFCARVFQHEIDHLDGIVFTDRMQDLSSLGFSRELERFGSPDGADEA